MTDTNTVILAGRLTKEPEIRVSQKGTKWASFTIATGGSKDGNEPSNFIRCKAFGGVAEKLETAQKGEQIRVVGSIRTGSYDNKAGDKVYTTDVYVDLVHIEAKKGAETPSRPAAQKAVDHDEIPF